MVIQAPDSTAKLVAMVGGMARWQNLIAVKCEGMSEEK